jgi:glutaredoxin
MNYILYSTGCPKCEILKKKLQQKNIQYVEVNDIDIMTEKNIIYVPMLEVDEKLLNYREAVDLINNI